MRRDGSNGNALLRRAQEAIATSRARRAALRRRMELPPRGADRGVLLSDDYIVLSTVSFRRLR